MATRKPKRKTPTRGKRGRPAGDTQTWRAPFLVALQSTGNVSAACQAAGVVRATVYAFKARDEQFAAEWAEAMEIAIELLEAEARRRAMTISDTLLIFLLKAHKPTMYRDRVDLRFFHTEAESIAKEYDLDPDAVLAEAQRMVNENK